ncbi:MAG TPA: hypothetical protein VG917_00715 [Patescibacteria group bacterium]|nr:hypothetical protein [Patescibacteria group bacterium]
MREYKPYLIWVLIVGGLLWGYDGLTGNNLLVTSLGLSLANVIEIVVGIVAVIVAYLKLTGKKKK